MAKTVILMEFRPEYITQFETIIEKTSFSLIGVAPEGGELIDLIKQMKTPPELVIITLMVQNGMDGVAAIKEIQKLKQGIKVILSYTIDSKMRLVEGLKAGALDRFRKPFDAAEVEKKMTKVHLMKSEAGGGFFRDTIRLTKPLPIEFSKKGLFAKKNGGRTLDISIDGCKIQSNVPVAKKDEIKLWLEIPRHGMIKIIGKIANVDHNKLHSTYEAGVSFTKISEKDKEALNLYIMDEADKI